MSMRWIERQWQQRGPVSLALLPLSWVYCLLVELRRFLYRTGLWRRTRLPVPVIVVGNITVGGTGKTPLTIWLAGFLRQHGYRPGIVTRGYGGRSPAWPLAVRPDTDPALVGDEPVLLARGSGCPVMADPRRARAAERLIQAHGCNLILSDDGLQHLALARDIEIAVIDGVRRFGNGYCLPAGPLREPVRRLDMVQTRVTQGLPQAGELGMQLVAGRFQPLRPGPPAVTAQFFHGHPVHAVAGIGYPPRFFDLLRQLGLEVIEHPFPDHHTFRPEDIRFGDPLPVIMTAKDAVKCERFADSHCWYLDVEAKPDLRLGERLLSLLEEYKRG
jgi:tetraacyldisaccharide 4'-kinase